MHYEIFAFYLSNKSTHDSMYMNPQLTAQACMLQKGDRKAGFKLQTTPDQIFAKRCDCEV